MLEGLTLRRFASKVQLKYNQQDISFRQPSQVIIVQARRQDRLASPMALLTIVSCIVF